MNWQTRKWSNFTKSKALVWTIFNSKKEELEPVGELSDQLSDVDSHNESQLYIFEDNEAVIKMIIEGGSPTMRHVSRNHTVALDWLLDRINLEPKIQIKFVNTRNQLADILTKGSFSRDEWNHLLCLINIMSFSMYSCSRLENFLSDDPDPRESKTPCRKEARKRVRMKALQRRKKAKPCLGLREREPVKEKKT